MIRKLTLCGGAMVAAATFALVGCSPAPPAAGTGAAPHKDGDHKDDKEGEHKEGTGHEHKPGGHGGVIVSLGKDSYHAEAVFEKDGGIRLYILGKDEIKPQEVEVQDLVAHVTPSGSADAAEVKVAAERQKADAVGKTSQFVAKLPPELQGKKVKVVINNIQVGSERFRIEFSNEKSEAAGHGH